MKNTQAYNINLYGSNFIRPLKMVRAPSISIRILIFTDGIWNTRLPSQARVSEMIYMLCKARKLNTICIHCGNGVRRYKSLVFFYFISFLKLRRFGLKKSCLRRTGSRMVAFYFHQFKGCISGEYKLYIKFYLII